MAIVDIKSGKTLSAKEIKAAVMKAKGWTSAEYQREYDKLRNRTRNYEQITGRASGSIKVNELLYTQTKAQARYGAAYRPSRQLQAIQATPSTGTAVVRQKGVSARVISTQERILKAQFAGFTQKSTEGARVLQLYEMHKAGTLDAEIDRVATEFEEAIDAGEYDLAEQLRAELRELSSAPKDVAGLRRALDSAAKSLKQYQKTKRDEWVRRNPDAPASYAVGTP